MENYNNYNNNNNKRDVILRKIEEMNSELKKARRRNELLKKRGLQTDETTQLIESFQKRVDVVELRVERRLEQITSKQVYFLEELCDEFMNTRSWT